MIATVLKYCAGRTCFASDAALDLAQDYGVVILTSKEQLPMTWNDAAEKVLDSEKKPVHYKALAKKIIEGKLVETKGKTPHNTLYVSISVENKSRQEKGKAPRFFIERGEVGLAAWARSAAKAKLIKQVQSERERVKTEVLKRLRQLSGTDFESYLETLLVKLGYEGVELRGGPSDEGIDLF
jgi:restriction endonuclease Mrr